MYPQEAEMEQTSKLKKQFNSYLIHERLSDFDSIGVSSDEFTGNYVMSESEISDMPLEQNQDGDTADTCLQNLELVAVRCPLWK